MEPAKVDSVVVYNAVGAGRTVSWSCQWSTGIEQIYALIFLIYRYMSMTEYCGNTVFFLAQIQKPVVVIVHILHMSVGDKDIAVFCFGYGKIVCTVVAVAVAGNRDYRYIEFRFQFIGIAFACLLYVLSYLRP